MSNTVRAILERKGREVVTATPQATLADVAGLLDRKKIGAVVIEGLENRIAGIFTERDLVAAVARFGTGALEQPVASVMTTKVQSCREETTVNELMEQMTSGRFRHMPVEHEGRLAGIVSIGDVVKSRIAEIEREAEDIKAYIAG